MSPYFTEFVLPPPSQTSVFHGVVYPTCPDPSVVGGCHVETHGSLGGLSWKPWSSFGSCLFQWFLLMCIFCSTREDVFLLNKKTCLSVEEEASSSCWTRRHVFLLKKTCLLVEEVDMSSCWRRRHVFLLKQKTWLLVQEEDMSSSCSRGRNVFLVKKKQCLLVEQEDISSCRPTSYQLGTNFRNFVPTSYQLRTNLVPTSYQLRTNFCNFVPTSYQNQAPKWHQRLPLKST